MRLPPQARKIARQPGSFAWQTLKAFKANQGLLLAGAVAYYALLSIVPLLILIAIAISQWIDPAQLLAALERYLEWLIPGEGRAVVAELATFLEHKHIGWLLLATMIFFSGLAFTVLENAMSVIFFHRVQERKRRYVVSALLPYCYVLSLGVGVLLVTLVSGSLQAMGERDVEFLGHTWSLGGISGVLLYLLGFAGEVFVLTSIYLVMPVGRLKLSHALVGGVTAAVERARRAQPFASSGRSRTFCARRSTRSTTPFWSMAPADVMRGSAARGAPIAR